MNNEDQKQVTIEQVQPAKFGSKDDVFNGLAAKTKGGLTKDDLVLNKKNKVVSKKMQANAMARFHSKKE